LNVAAIQDALLDLFENEPVVEESHALQKQYARAEPERRYPHMSEEREAKLLSR
jgi:hypothetical protein